jgi:hypothetical protein
MRPGRENNRALSQNGAKWGKMGTEPLFFSRHFLDEIGRLLIFPGVGTARRKGSESPAEKRLQSRNEIIFPAGTTRLHCLDQIGLGIR